MKEWLGNTSIIMVQTCIVFIEEVPINIKGQPRIESSDNHCRIQCELSMIRLSEIGS